MAGRSWSLEMWLWGLQFARISIGLSLFPDHHDLNSFLPEHTSTMMFCLISEPQKRISPSMIETSETVSPTKTFPPLIVLVRSLGHNSKKADQTKMKKEISPQTSQKFRGSLEMILKTHNPINWKIQNKWVYFWTHIQNLPFLIQEYRENLTGQ